MGCKCSNENPIEEEIIKEEKKKVDFNESYSEISKTKNKDDQIVISDINLKSINDNYILSKIYVKKEEKKKMCFNKSDSNEIESNISERKNKDNQNNISNVNSIEIESNISEKKIRIIKIIYQMLIQMK